MAVKYRPDRSGLRALLRSSEVERDLMERGERVAAAARSAPWDQHVSGVPGTEVMPVTVKSEPTPNRARVRVTLAHPSGLAVEAKHGVLLRSLDSA